MKIKLPCMLLILNSLSGFSMDPPPESDFEGMTGDFLSLVNETQSPKGSADEFLISIISTIKSINENHQKIDPTDLDTQYVERLKQFFNNDEPITNSVYLLSLDLFNELLSSRSFALLAESNLFKTIKGVVIRHRHRVSSEEVVLTEESSLDKDASKTQIDKNYLAKVLKLQQEINKKYHEFLIANYSDPSAADFFDDLNSTKLTNYLSSVRIMEKPVELESANFLPNAVFGKLPLIFIDNKDDHEVVLSFSSTFGIQDKLYGSLTSAFQNFLGQPIKLDAETGINANAEVTDAANAVYKIILANFSDKIKNALAQGKTIRLIGYGSSGSVAELVAYRLRKEWLKNNANNSIQVVTFSSSDSVHTSSKPIYDLLMKNNIVRFRFENDKIAATPYTNSVATGVIFHVKDEIKVSYGYDGGHLPDYYQGNLNNTAMFINFKEHVMAYRLLKIDEEVIGRILKKSIDSDSKIVCDTLHNLHALKLNILSFYKDNESGKVNEKKANVLGSIKLNCVALLRDDENGLPSIKLILDLIDNKELSTKKQSLGGDALFSQSQIFESVKGLLSTIQSGDNDKKKLAFMKIIATIGHNSKMLLEYFDLMKNDHLRETLLNFLVGSYKAKYKAQFDGLAKENSDRLDRYYLSMAETELSSLVGNGFRPTGKGATGTLFALDLKGNIVGIFKREGQDNILKRTGGQRALLSPHDMAQPFGECASYKVSLDFKFDVAPISTMTSFHVAGQEINGAFLELLQDYREINSTDVNSSFGFKPEGQTRFQLITIFDFFIGQLDRHDDNLFISNSTGDLKSLMTIDNANSFPMKGVNSVNGHNMYKWSEYDIANNEFTPEALEFIENIKTDQMGELVTYLNNIYSGYLNKEMIDYLKLRFELVKSLVDKGSAIKTPRDLAEFKTRKSIRDHLESLKQK